MDRYRVFLARHGSTDVGGVLSTREPFLALVLCQLVHRPAGHDLLHTLPPRPVEEHARHRDSWTHHAWVLHTRGRGGKRIRMPRAPCLLTMTPDCSFCPLGEPGA